MSQIILPNNIDAIQNTSMLPAEAIINYMFNSILHNMSIAAFVKIFTKEEAEAIMLNAFQKEYVNFSDLFMQIGASDPAASGKLKEMIEKSFDIFKNEILKAYHLEEK